MTDCRRSSDADADADAEADTEADTEAVRCRQRVNA